jgi:hypothetical protein
VTELDLDRIKAATAELDDDVSDSVWTQRAIRVVAQVPRMIAELERLGRLCGPAELPSVDAYENVVQALADERAEVVRLCDLLLVRAKEREDLRRLLAEVLHHFPVPAADKAGTYEPVRSDPVPVVALERWRSHLGGVS